MGATRRAKLARLERKLGGGLESFQLLNGRRYYYGMRAHGEVFSHIYDLELGLESEPPEILKKLCQAKDPAAVLERFTPPNRAFFTLREVYDLDVLVNERRLVQIKHEPPPDLSE